MHYATFEINILMKGPCDISILEIAPSMTVQKVSVFGVILIRIQSKCGIIPARRTPNKSAFHVVPDDFVTLLLNKRLLNFLFLFYSAV